MRQFVPVVLAAALVMAPLGAQAADLVVWWEKGYYPAGGRGGQGDHRRLRAGDRQAGRARLPSAGRSFRTRSWRRSRPASRPTSRSALCIDDYIAQWAFDDRLVDLSEPSATSRICSIRTRSRATLLNGKTGRGGCTRCRWAARPTTSTSGKACWSRPASRSPTSQGVGGVLVVLVRPGPAGRAPGHGSRRHLGRRAAHVGRACDTVIQFRSSWLPTMRTT